MRLLLLLAALAFPGVGLAKPVTVQSGEHAGFTRLVVYYKGVTPWSFGAEAGGYALRPEKPDTTYDLDRVFQLIPRDRIADLSARPDGSLFLSVTCACHAEVFEHLGQVVVDVKDGAAPPGTEAPGPALPDTTARAAPSAPLPGFNVPPPYKPRGSGIAWGDTDLSVPLAAKSPFAVSGPTRGRASDPRIAETRASLVMQIARAASDGLVTPDATVPHAATENASPTDTHAEIEGPGPAVRPIHPSGSNIRIETAFQRSELATAVPEPRNQSGDTCLPSSKFDLAEWGRPPDQGTAIADYRAGLVGEFDAADPKSLANLARHYIYLTFGAEAQSLIRSFGAQIEDMAILNMLADIMDDGHSDAFPAIASQLSCDSAPALWALLASSNLTAANQVSRTAVLSAFSALPLHLRRHLGPGLSARFVQVGDTDTAATIRNTITRAPGPATAEIKMMEAGIALELGDHQYGLDQLSEVIEDNGPRAPAAVISLIEASLAAGETPDAKLVQSAQALAFEARGSDEGARLKIASLRAQVHGGDIIEALVELDSSISAFDLSEQQVSDLRREAIDLASRSDSNALFLQVALVGVGWLGTDPTSGAIRRRTAARLIDLGLFAKARELLGEDPGVPTPQDRLLYAQSHIGQDRPDLAIGYLAGLTDPAARTLRARAHAMAQEYERASTLYADLDLAEESARAAWRGQNLEAVRQIGSPAEAAAARLGTGEMTVPEDGTAGAITLAEGEEALKQSRETRQVLATLLAEIGLP